MNPEPNPYRPPGAELAGDSLPGAVYSPGQASAAGFLGGPLAGAVLIALNYRDLRNLRAQRIAVLVGVVASAATFMLAWVLPERTPSVALPLLCALVARFMTHHLQGQTYYSLRESGGARQSNWRVVGISLACTAVTAVLAFGVLLLIPEQFWPA